MNQGRQAFLSQITSLVEMPRFLRTFEGTLYKISRP